MEEMQIIVLNPPIDMGSFPFIASPIDNQTISEIQQTLIVETTQTLKEYFPTIQVHDIIITPKTLTPELSFELTQIQYTSKNSRQKLSQNELQISLQ